MTLRTSLRPGGRSARVQAAVHQAVQAIDTELGRAALTVPLIADRAGVTPSTIYRRWGTLQDLLTDVALGSMRAEGAPVDTGTLLGDLHAWTEQYLEEMSSTVGLTMMHDVLASNRADAGCQCALFTASQIGLILERGAARGDVVPQVDAVMDTVVAPIIYRTLFGPAPLTRAHVRTLVEQCVSQAALASSASPIA